MDKRFIASFRERLRRLERIMGTNVKNETECCGLNLTQCHTLLEIAYRGEVSLVDVAGALELDTSTLSRSVNTMVNLGLINRNTNPDDRRFVTLTLTEQGRSLFEKIEMGNNSYFTRVFQLIPDEKHAQIIESLDLFLNAFEASDRTADYACCVEEFCEDGSEER